MQIRSLALSALAVASMVAAEFKITAPSSDIWWVAKSTNVLTWTCNEPGAPMTFTVLVSNPDVTILPQPLAIIAIQNNYQCSLIVTQDQSAQAAGTGYQILFADPLNNTNVYARSDPFEIKPLGSLYPTQAQAKAEAEASSASASAAAAQATNTSESQGSGALSMGAGAVSGIVAGVAGLVGGLAAAFL